MMLRALPLTAALLVALVGCSSSSTSPAAPTTPRVSVAEETPSPAADTMDAAVSFATAVYNDDWDQAGSLVADNTIAARYVTHQAAAAQVDDLNGNSISTDPSDIDVTPDKAARTVTIEDRSGDTPATRVWQDFEFQDGKVASGEVEGQPKLANRLWSTKSTDRSDGVSAELVSAYQQNSKNLLVVVRLASSSKNVRVMNAAYTPTGGFKHEDTASLSADVDKGSKGLTYFIYNKAPVGGKLKLTVDKIDSDDSSYSDYLTTLSLQVR